MPHSASRPIRVLELRSVCGPGGGPEKTILQGTAQTDPSRFAVTVCYIRDRRDAAFGITARAANTGIDYVEVEERHSMDPAIWPALRQLVRARQIDIVHAHEYKTDLLALMLSKVEKVIPLATVHGWTGHSWRERAIYYPMDKRILARFPKLIAVSGEIRQSLIAGGADPQRVDVVLNGIEPSKFVRVAANVPAARARFGVQPGELVLGSVGRLEPQKRFDLLIEAVAALHREMPQIRLLIAGEGSCRAALEAQIAQLGLQQVVRLVGLISGVSEFHHALDLFVQSSMYEGTPNVVLEAMALETPVVATDVGGTAELLRDGLEGIIVPPLDLPALTDGIRRSLAEAARTQEGVRRGRARIETDLSFARRMATVERVYETLMAQRTITPGVTTWSTVAGS